MNIFDKITSLPLPTLNHWGYWVILLFVILEATPVFGLLVPGQIFAIAGGFMAKLGVLDIGDVIFVCALGAILGDMTGYWIGIKYGNNFLEKYGKYVLFKKEYYEKTKKIINHHPFKALIIGRFNSLTRSFAPFVAGATKISFLKFFIANIIGGISWAVPYVLIGYIFGHGYQLAAKYLEEAALGILVIGLFSYCGYRFLRTRQCVFRNNKKNK